MSSGKPIIRSLTIFSEDPGDKDYIGLLRRYSRLLDDAKKLLNRNGYQVFTTRISLPKLGLGIVEELLDNYSVGGKLVSLGGFDIDSIDKDLVLDIVSKGYYLSLYRVWEKPLEYSVKASEIIHYIADENPVYATRLAIAFHEELLETPYFPDSMSSGVFGLGLSFLYPDTIIEYYRIHDSLEGFTEYMASVVNDINNLLKKLYGRNVRIIYDYSISPWMENSVVKLLSIMGYKLLEPGFNYGVMVLNNMIREMVEKIGYSSGFNEVMLPYAEDSSLVEAGGERRIRARDLLLYSISCVAGPDMIVVPGDVVKLSRYILDTYSVWRVKKRPLALRIIPVSADPGVEVELGKFGKVYVIDY